MADRGRMRRREEGEGEDEEDGQRQPIRRVDRVDAEEEVMRQGDEDEEDRQRQLIRRVDRDDAEEEVMKQGAPAGRQAARGWRERLRQARERQRRICWEDMDRIVDAQRMHVVYDLVLSRLSVLRRLPLRGVCRRWRDDLMDWRASGGFPPATGQYVLLYQRGFIMLYDPEEQRWGRMRVPFPLPLGHHDPRDTQLHLPAILLDSSHGLLCLMLEAAPAETSLPGYVFRVWNVATQTWVDVPPVPERDNPALFYARPGMFTQVPSRYWPPRYVVRRAREFIPVYVRVRPAVPASPGAGFLLSVAGFVDERRPPFEPDQVHGLRFVVSTYSSDPGSWSTPRAPDMPLPPDGWSTFLNGQHSTAGKFWVHHLSDPGLGEDPDKVFFVQSNVKHTPPGAPVIRENTLLMYNESTGELREHYPVGAVIQPPAGDMMSPGCLVRCGDQFYLVVRDEDMACLRVYKLESAVRAWVLQSQWVRALQNFQPGVCCVGTRDCIFIVSERSMDLALLAYNVETRAWSFTPPRTPRAAWRHMVQMDFWDILGLHLTPNPCTLANS